MKTIEAVKFINENKKYLPSDKTDFLISRLTECEDVNFEILENIKLTSPRKVLIISLFFGIFGLDRFFIGDYFFAFLKLFSLGGFGFLMIFDWFYILKRVKKINYLNLLSIYYYYIHIF